VSFTFVNHAREGSGCGHWNLYKLVDGAGAGGETASGGRWYHLGPNVHTADCRHVGPGGAKRVTLRAFHDEGLGCGSCGCGREFTFDHLGGGRYAMVAGYGHATDYSAAMVAVDAPAVEVTPTDDADSERDGATVVVTTDRAGGGDQADPATVEVARADDADDRLIAEQVMQRRGLRNALPFFESGVETVVVHTDERVARRAAGFGDEPRRFRFDGTTYEARPVEAA
jgi:hypothetical protein